MKIAAFSFDSSSSGLISNSSMQEKLFQSKEDYRRFLNFKSEQWTMYMTYELVNQIMLFSLI
jgi:hypothetical protein